LKQIRNGNYFRSEITLAAVTATGTGQERMPDGGPGLTAVGKQLVIVCEHHCRHLQSKHTENKLLRTVFTHTKNSDSQSSQCSTLVRNTVVRATFKVNGKPPILGSRSPLTP